MSVKLDLLGTIIKQASGEKLFSLLNSIAGPKDLIIDKDLIRSLEYIASFSQLKSCNVEKVFKLEPGSVPGATNKCVYVMKPSIQNAKIIADHINASKSIDSPKHFWVINVSRKLFKSDTVLEREGVYGFATQMELPLGFLCLDKDLFSLEIRDFFPSFFLNGDLTQVHTAAMALVQLFRICGPIPKIVGQGKCSQMVIELMNKISKETNFNSTGAEKISHLIILDRDVDYVSALLSQVTYEGLLDELYGIENGRIALPKEVTGKDEAIKMIVNSSDPLFEEIRNKYFSSVCVFLSEKSKEIVEKRSGTSSMSIEQMKHFVTKEMHSVRQQQAILVLHMNVCERILAVKTEQNLLERLRMEHDILLGYNLRNIVTYTEDVINRQDSYSSALRLMCLLSISQDGIPPNDYHSLCTQFRQSHGCEYVLTLQKLKKLGLLVEQAPLLQQSSSRPRKLTEAATSKATKIAEKVVTAVAFPKTSSFKTIAKKLNLVPSENEKIDLTNPTHLSYVFAGSYVPIVARITEQIILHDALKNLEDGMKLLSGSTITHTNADKEAGHVKPSKDVHSKTILVYLLGGITYAEVAALRLLGKLHNTRILIATTSIISAGSLMAMLLPPDACAR